ncbi:MAG: hypothetical protein JF599_06060 [Verrucomicrobia bacterium]|nr:hypothetical protein [Verrucomicrobiota bacterium]
MNDRLQELLRQQALAREQLAWLEKEIARESAAASPTPPAPTLAPQIQPAITSTPEEADALLDKYAKAERHNPRALKRGCLLLFFVVLGLCVLLTLTIYFLHYRHR